MPRAENGQFTKKDMKKRREAAKDKHGFGNLKTSEDYYQNLINVTEKAMTKQGTKRAEVAQKDVENVVNLQSDMAEIYMPDADFMSAPSSGDAWSDAGRIPLQYIVPMTQYRLGWAYRATFGTARDIYRNGYDFVPIDAGLNADPVPKPEIRKWMDEVDFFSFRTQQLFRDRQTGLGVGVLKFPGDTDLTMKDPYKGNKRPIALKAFSTDQVTPRNFLHYEFGDYDKSKWDFRGGIRSTLFHHDRINLLETRPEPFSMRGLSVIEPVWTAAVCYYNTMIFCLKSLAQVGVMTVGVKSANDIPRKKEVEQTLDYLDKFRANKFYYLGKDAELVMQNQAANISRGLQEWLEFLREDISSALIIPKNQLFGRSDGGGLDGAGALVSKDDYLSSLMADAGDITAEELALLRGPCKFEKHLEGLTIRWRLDLHKTEMERLNEEAARLQLKVQKEQAKEVIDQIKFNRKLRDKMKEQFEEDPEAFLENTETNREEEVKGGLENEGKLQEVDEGKESKDFVDYMQYYKNVRYDFQLPFRARRVNTSKES